MWLIDANEGWKTVEVNKKEVPLQKASMAFPPSASVIIGRATLRDVASRAATKVIMHIVTNIIWNLHPGLKTFKAFSTASSSSFVFAVARSVDGSIDDSATLSNEGADDAKALLSASAVFRFLARLWSTLGTVIIGKSGVETC